VQLFRIYVIYFIKYPQNNQPFSHSKEVNMPPQTLDEILKGRRSQPNQLIEVLQDVQKNYGYISKDAMQTVSQGLGVPLMEVYRVASFYKAFRLKPSGKHILTMCMGTACHVQSSRLLLDQAMGQLGVKPGEVTRDGLFSIEHVNCLGACALGPIVTENGSYHHHMTPGKLRKLIETLRLQKTEAKQNVQAQ
jgi:NADH:ubiquinone oxidoreductase subunit E